jgi:very-short-patch-repair endonuclease
MGRRKKQGAETIIGPLFGLFVLGLLFAPRLLKGIIITVLIISVLAVIFILTKWWVTRQTQEQKVSEGLISETPPPLPELTRPRRFTAKNSLLTPAEKDFHRVLMRAVPEAPIFPKVRVADVIDAAERYSGDFLRISQKHFDWVLCDPNSYEPLAIIELDDSSHHWSQKQRKNDETKNEAAQEANIPLLRFKCCRSYNEENIRTRIAEIINRLADQKEASIKITPTDTASIGVQITAEIEASIHKRNT